MPSPPPNKRQIIKVVTPGRRAMEDTKMAKEPERRPRHPPAQMISTNFSQLTATPSHTRSFSDPTPDRPPLRSILKVRDPAPRSSDPSTFLPQTPPGRERAQGDAVRASLRRQLFPQTQQSDEPVVLGILSPPRRRGGREAVPNMRATPQRAIERKERNGDDDPGLFTPARRRGKKDDVQV